MAVTYQPRSNYSLENKPQKGSRHAFSSNGVTSRNLSVLFVRKIRESVLIRNSLSDLSSVQPVHLSQRVLPSRRFKVHLGPERRARATRKARRAGLTAYVAAIPQAAAAPLILRMSDVPQNFTRGYAFPHPLTIASLPPL